MSIALSSRRPRSVTARARRSAIVASCALLAMLRPAWADSIRMVHFSEENLPAQEMPTGVASPEAGPTADWIVAPASASTAASAAPALAPAAAAAPAIAAPALSPAAADSAALAEPTPMAAPTDIAPLEVGSVAPELQISDSSLDGLIQKERATQPALAASLRVTDQAREQIMNHHEDDAIQTLSTAMSIDGGNPYAYFYVGRAYLAKKNYDQAITFFTRAENRLADNPPWLGETYAFEGLSNEEAGNSAQAIACYQKALVAVPGNLMARVGLTRLAPAPVQPAPEVQSASAPEQAGTAPDAAPAQAESAPASAEDAAAPAPAAQPPPPAN